MIYPNQSDGIHNSGDFYQDDTSSRPASSQGRRPDTGSNLSLDGSSGTNTKKKPIADKKDKDSNSKSLLKPFLQFLMSYLGLIFAVALYVAGGAYLFQILEQHNSVQNCQVGEGEWDNLLVSYRTTLFNYIYFNTTSDPWLPVDNSTIIPSLNTPRDPPWIYNPKITAMLNDFANQVWNLSSTYGYSGQDCVNDDLWEYFSALLFTVTIVTTIGYGYITPKTWEGQIVCICYATLGIPLFLMSLAKVSFLLADLFRYLYRRFFCAICVNALESSRRKAIAVDSQVDAVTQLRPTNVDDLTSQDPVSTTTSTNRAAGTTATTATNASLTGASANNASQVIIRNDDELDYEYMNDDSHVKVPLAIVIGFFLAYIVLGGFIFVQIENLTWVQSIYYCYISLATIGFGDIVPGVSEIESGQTNIGIRNILIEIVYIFLGMANLAMAFDLLSEQLSEKFSAIAIKLGFKSEDDEDEEEEDKKKQQKKLPTIAESDFNNYDNELIDKRTPSDLYITNAMNSSREPTRITVKSKDSRHDDDYYKMRHNQPSDKATRSKRQQREASNAQIQSREQSILFPGPLS